MTNDPLSVVPRGWTVVEFDEADDYHPWCSEESPEQTSEGDDGPR